MDCCMDAAAADDDDEIPCICIVYGLILLTMQLCVRVHA